MEDYYNVSERRRLNWERDGLGLRTKPEMLQAGRKLDLWSRTEDEDREIEFEKTLAMEGKNSFEQNVKDIQQSLLKMGGKLDEEAISDKDNKSALMGCLAKMGLQSIKFARIKRESDRGTWGLGIALLGNIERMMCQADTGKLRDQKLQAEVRAAVVKKLWPLRDKLEELKDEIRKMLEQHQKLKYWQTMTEAVRGEGEYIKTYPDVLEQRKDYIGVRMETENWRLRPARTKNNSKSTNT